MTRDRTVRIPGGSRGIRRTHPIVPVPRPAAGAELEARLREAVSRRLSELGVAEPRVAVERREGLTRSAGGKLQLVVADQESARDRVSILG